MPNSTLRPEPLPSNAFIDNLRQRTPLSDDDVRRLGAISDKPRRYPAKQHLIRDGNPPGPLYIFLEAGCRSRR